MVDNDTSLIRMVIKALVEEYNWEYSDAIEKFYNSKTCEILSDESNGVYTYSPYEIVSMFEEEIKNK